MKAMPPRLVTPPTTSWDEVPCGKDQVQGSGFGKKDVGSVLQLFRIWLVELLFNDIESLNPAQP